MAQCTQARVALGSGDGDPDLVERRYDPVAVQRPAIHALNRPASSLNRARLSRA